MEKNCKKCDEKFYITEGEVKFFKEKDLLVPEHCKLCRQKKQAIKFIYKLFFAKKGEEVQPPEPYEEGDRLNEQKEEVKEVKKQEK